MAVWVGMGTTRHADADATGVWLLRVRVAIEMVVLCCCR
jgi:hypothetical protein